MAVLLALALAASPAAPADAAAPRPPVVSAGATARVEIIRFEPVAASAPGQPVLLRQRDRETRGVTFF